MAKYSSEGVEREVRACQSAGWSEALTIQSMSFSDSDMKLLVMEQGSHMLQRFQMRDTPNITDVALQYLSHLKGLRELNLGCVSITDDGLRSLSGLRRLVSLGLATDTITNEGIKHIGEISTLETLILCGAELTGECCEHLENLRSLSELRLGGMSMEITDAHCPSIGKLLGLRRLVMVEARMWGKKFESWAELRLLESIWFLGCPWLVGLTSLESLLPPRGSLRELNIRDSGLPDEVRDLTDARSIIAALGDPPGPPTLVVSHALSASDQRMGKLPTLSQISQETRTNHPKLRWTKIDMAIKYLAANPGWTDRQIAQAVPCSPSTLCSNKRYQRARAAIRSGEALPRGTKFDGKVDGIAPTEDDK